MNPYQVILVPTDFDGSAQLALEHAISIARGSNARIILYYVYPSPYETPWGGVLLPDAEINAIVERVLAAGRDRLAKIIDEQKDCGVAMTAATGTGDARQCILEAVEEHDVDLIVMGTHGRQGLARMWLGSTAEGVVRMSPVPVLTVRGPAAA